MSWLTQIGAVTLLNLRTLPQRIGSSTVAVVGIAGVVIVFVAVLSMAEGFFAAMSGAGLPERALVMRGGADDEMTSGLGGPETEIIRQAPGIRREGQRVLASAELFVIVDLPKRSTMTAANVPMRGVEPVTPQVRHEMRLVEGRMLQFGTNEIVAGRAASRQFAGLSVGSLVKIRPDHLDRGRDLRIGRHRVGDRALGRRAGAAGRLSSRQQLSVDAGAPRVSAVLHCVQGLAHVEPAAERLRSERGRLLHRPVDHAHQPDSDGRIRIASLMGLGAIFGAILTMYTAVATRSRESLPFARSGSMPFPW